MCFHVLLTIDICLESLLTVGTQKRPLDLQNIIRIKSLPSLRRLQKCQYMVGETNEIPLHYCYSGKVKRWWVDKPVAVNGGVGVPHIVGEDSSLCQLGDNLLWF